MGMEKPPRVISLRLQWWLCAIPFFGICIVLLIGFANIYRYSGGRKYVFCYFFACCLPMLALFAAGICCVACWCGSFLNVCIQSRFLRCLRAREERRRQADLL